MSRQAQDYFYKLYSVPSAGYYVAPRMTIPGLYGSRLRISVPEPDGEIMLTVMDQDGVEITDIYVDPCELVKAITEVEEAYAAIPEEGRKVPTRPAANHPPVEGSHP